MDREKECREGATDGRRASGSGCVRVRDWDIGARVRVSVYIQQLCWGLAASFPLAASEDSLRPENLRTNLCGGSEKN